MRTPRSSKSRIGKKALSAIRSKQPSGTIPKTRADYGCLSSVTVHGVAVILIAAKNLTWLRGMDEILRCDQNDGVFASP